MGRPPIGKAAMTGSERVARCRARKRRLALLDGRRDKPSLRTPRAIDDVEQDLWSTPPCLIAALTGIVLPSLPARPIWEPAAGAGALVDALIAAKYEVFASDIESHRRDIARVDYLSEAPPPATRGAIVVTNPPFSQLDAFLSRTLALIDAGWLAAAVLLVRTDFAGTDGRANMLNRAVAEWECTWRARWIPGSTGNPRWWCQWIAWLAGRDGPPVHYRLRRRELARGSSQERADLRARQFAVGE
jgi:hypothetical protein